MAATSTAVVETKSAWLSKVNWTQAVGLLSTVIALSTAGKYELPAEQQVTIVAVIQGAQSVATWIIKTWFTPTVTTASLPQ